MENAIYKNSVAYPIWDEFVESIIPLIEEIADKISQQETEDRQAIREIELLAADVIGEFLTPEIEISFEAEPEHNTEELIAIDKFFHRSEEVEIEIRGPRFFASCLCGWPGNKEFVIDRADNIMDAYEIARVAHDKALEQYSPKIRRNLFLVCQPTVRRSPLH